VPLPIPARCVYEPSGSDIKRKSALSAKEPLPGRHDPCDLRTFGFYRETGLARAKTQGQPHSIPRRFTPGVLPCALRASLRLFKIAPGDFVAPNSKHRIQVTPSGRGKGKKKNDEEHEDKTPHKRRSAMVGFLLLQNRQPCHPWQ